MTEAQNSMRVNMIFIKFALSFISVIVTGCFIFLWGINAFMARTGERLDKLEPHVDTIQTIQNMNSADIGKHDIRITRLEAQAIK